MSKYDFLAIAVFLVLVTMVIIKVVFVESDFKEGFYFVY